MDTPPPILIADDDRTMIRLMQLSLKRLGREVHATGNGDEALELVRTLKPSLLILDLNMPRRGGIEVLRTLRRERPAHKMAIVVVSAQAQADTADYARESGAHAYFSKPVVLRDLVDRARDLLAEVETSTAP